MTVKTAIKELRKLKSSNDFTHYLWSVSPTCVYALSMAISALEDKIDKVHDATYNSIKK